ncbi:MAG: hypothetical protein J6V07_04875, partial [Clostridia bacterium]|nr:hypothetical protein [Clostridia bacterium]
ELGGEVVVGAVVVAVGIIPIDPKNPQADSSITPRRKRRARKKRFILQPPWDTLVYAAGSITPSRECQGKYNIRKGGRARVDKPRVFWYDI